MTHILKRGVSLLFFLLLVLATSAQTNLLNVNNLSDIHIENFSDEEIASLYQKALNSGINESQLYSLLQQRGLSPAETEKLRIRIQNLGKASGPSGRQVIPDTLPSTRGRFDSTLGRVPAKTNLSNPLIFGSELFTSNSLVFEPNLRIPAPPNYTLGPDDELIISVYGYSEKKYDARVNELGEIYIPNVGPILVSGLTMEQASEKIKNKLAATIYSAIRSGQTKVQITLGKIRSIRVTVIGQANKPGTYTVSSLTTLYNILYLCGGPTEMGSYRNIEIIRGNEKRTADLYDFLIDGIQKGNILLQEGDVVRIPYYENRITLSGNVKRTGLYELKKNETFTDLLKFSGGFTDSAYRGAVTVERITDSLRKIIDLPSSAYTTFQIKGSDKFIVSKLMDVYGNRIYITGAVQRPGPYEWRQGIAVKELIAKAGGLTTDAFTQRALIYRYQENMQPEMQSVNLDSVLQYGSLALLKKNDSLVINTISFFKEKETISINGNVRIPASLPWRKNMKLMDAILSSGGITEAGDSTNIELSRRITSTNVEEADHQESQLFNLNLNDPATPYFALMPYDLIIVKDKPGYMKQRTVTVTGEVVTPGIFALENSGARISDVLSRVKGFKSSADSTSLIIQRLRNKDISPQERKGMLERIMNIDQDSISRNQKLASEITKNFDLISVDLKSVMNNPSAPENLQLEDGDILYIARASNTVRVSGEVYFPSIIPYKKGANLKYYIQQAGNFMPKARKTGSLVISPNGKVASVKHFLFFKSYPEVTERSEIYVPQKELNNRAKMGAAEWAVIISALGIVSNVIINAIR